MHNRRNQVATKLRPPRTKARTKPGFPSEIAIPPHLGASARAVELPARVAAQPLFALPEREPPERLRTPTKPKRRKASPKRRKPSGKVRKAKVATPGIDLAEGIAAFALPRRDEPLVDSPPTNPARALAPLRPVSLIEQIGHWLGRQSEALWQRLGGSAPRGDAELRRLRAENAKLKAQLEAFLTLQQTTRSRAPGRASLPFP